MGLIGKLRAYLEEDEDFEAIDSKNEFAKSIKSQSDDESKMDEKSVTKAKKEKKSKSKKKSSKNTTTTEEPIDENLTQVNVSQSSDENDRKAVYDFCEQLIDVSYHLEDSRREYALVTDYLTDIQRIEDFPEDLTNEVVGLSRKIDMLERDRKTYMKSEELLTMEEFEMMQMYQDDTIDTVKKLYDMESRNSLLVNDMSHLEGEKEDINYMLDYYQASAFRVRGIIVTTLLAYIGAIFIMLAVSMSSKSSVLVYVLVVTLIAMIIFAASYMRYATIKQDQKLDMARINRAVSLLNKVKVKYINNLNAMEYIYKKYEVNSAKELERKYEYYEQMCRDALKYTRTSNDLNVYIEELVAVLERSGVKDASVWPRQVGALIDRHELNQIKHSLMERRSSVHGIIATSEKIKTNAEIALRAAVDANPGLQEYINDTLGAYKINL